jgi:glycosyltransferase involved in cell wall biosynthesis
MFCSTIIPTVGRSTLAQAVTSVLNQRFTNDRFEVIVVNDSGAPLPAADWQNAEQVRVINTNSHERSVARNTGAAIAQGQFLHFLDDDDWLLPDALQHLWTLAQSSSAAWLYGSTQLVDQQDKPLIVLQHGLQGICFLQTMAGEWIPLQASLIKAKTFFTIGGFNPLITGPEDIDLLRRMTLYADIAGTSALIACLRWRTESSTTDYHSHPDASRWARERILNTTGVFDRMKASADSGSWYGRLARIYLTSLIWNLRRKHFFTAASRAGSGLASFTLAGPQLFSLDFWQALATAYASDTFARGGQETSTSS